MQAAFDIVRPHGYRLLQYDWPDAVFVHRNYAGAFPCFTDDFMRTYWVGYVHARAHYRRFRKHQTHHDFVAKLPTLAGEAAFCWPARRASRLLLHSCHLLP